MPLFDCERIWLEYKDRARGYVFSHISDKEDDYLNQTTLDFLAQALKSLPSFERDALVLHYYKSVSLKKIAVLLKSTDGKIKLAHKRAIVFLKDKFKNYLPPIGVTDGSVRRVV